jgi:predicted dehydrogenase
MTRSVDRRTFLQGAALAGAGFWIAPEIALPASRSPGEKLNIGIIGAGGRGAGNTASVSSENIVSLCDVDEKRLDQAKKRYPKARTYVDFRRLLDASKDLDAVVVSTTEHTHAFATLPALQLGKHVYCEKPITHCIYEARLVAETAAKAKVATQMGTQIHAGDNYRRVVELVQSNAIGPIHECHVWNDRKWGGGDRPQETPPVPAHLHWDLWLGPAPERPYHPIYFPGPAWYKWWDFGNGTLSDMGSHLIDLAFWALKLRHPLTAVGEGPPVHPETAPTWIIITWQFPARESMPPVKLTWRHGGKHEELLQKYGLPIWGSGQLFIGEKGMILSDYGRRLLFPEKQFADFKPPAPSIPKSVGHHNEWIQACKTGSPTTCNFSYSGALVESNLLGIAAYRLGKKLEWDPVNLRATNCSEADRLIRKQYRKGWSLT